MANEFLIQKSTLENTANQIRQYLKIPYIFKSSINVNSESIEITKYYYLDIDRELYEGDSPKKYTQILGQIRVGYEHDNTNTVVPVLYETVDVGQDDSDGIVTDRYFYVGIETIEGEPYDKWRKIEEIADLYPNAGYCTWESSQESYLYTNQIVISTNDIVINPLDFPDKIIEVYYSGVASCPVYENGDEVRY